VVIRKRSSFRFRFTPLGPYRKHAQLCIIAGTVCTFEVQYLRCANEDGDREKTYTRRGVRLLKLKLGPTVTMFDLVSEEDGDSGHIIPMIQL